MTLDEVAAEPVGEANRALEVHRVAGPQVVEVRARQRLVDGVRLPPSRADVGDGQAAAVHGDRVADLGVLTRDAAHRSGTCRRRAPSTRPSSSTMPVNIDELHLEVVAELLDRLDAPAPDVGDRRRAGAGEQRPGVVAAEQRRRQVEDVAVDEPGAVEGARDGGAALHQHLHDAAATQLVEHVVEVAVELETRVDSARRGGALPSTTRAGRGPRARRTVSAGSSAFTVPAPTRTASLSARRRWASARAASPVIHWLVPSGAAVRPSSVAASLSTTQGRPVVRCLMYGASCGPRLGRDAPDRDVDAGVPQPGDAHAAHPGSGSSMPTTTRRTPAATMASAQGGGAPVVRARLERDDSVAPRAASPAASSATTSACGPPGGCVAPSNVCRRHLMTRPPTGWARWCRAPMRASSIARRMSVRSS